MAVGIRNQFIRSLGGSIETDRMIYCVVNAERRVLVRSVDAGTAGIDEVGYVGCPAFLDQVSGSPHTGTSAVHVPLSQESAETA